MTSSRCPTCEGSINLTSPRHRGLLINEIASLGSEMITLQERIIVLKNRRPSKRFKEEHEENLRMLADAEVRLAHAEGRRAGLTVFGREFCGL